MGFDALVIRHHLEMMERDDPRIAVCNALRPAMLERQPHALTERDPLVMERHACAVWACPYGPMGLRLAARC